MGSQVKTWVDGPFALISPSRMGDELEKRATGMRRLAAEMAMVHNAVIRGVNAVYLQCVNVSKRGTDTDKADFVNFAYQWCVMLEEHHDMEEETFFPEMNEMAGVPGLMDGNVEEHKMFHDGLDKYRSYLESVKEGKESYDGEKLKAILDEFLPTLHSHLVNEVDHLVSLETYNDKCDWAGWFNKRIGDIMSAKMRQSEFRTEQYPLIVVFHDRTFAGGVWANFPPIPWVVAWALKVFFVSKHQAWWRFAGCDLTGHPKDLPFA